MVKHFVATSHNGKEVYAYIMQPPLSAAVSRNPRLLSLVKEVLTTHDLIEPTIHIEHDMGRNIGHAERLKTQEKDVIFYARQAKSNAYTKFVKNRSSDATSFLTIDLAQDESGAYEVVSVCIGKGYPPTPGDDNENETSQAYWAEHAVVYNGQAIMNSSVTKDCPY